MNRLRNHVPRMGPIAPVFLFVIALCSVAASPSTQPVKFKTVDVFINPHGEALAAYQIEVNAESGNVKLAGVEGGTHPAYTNPPYYDPAALNSHRVILAAYSTAEDLPTAKVRVARLHLQVEGEMPRLIARPITAANQSGVKIDIELTVSEGTQP